MAELLTRLKAAIGDRYAIERELGRGGMAVVYLAQDLKHGRPVAIKVLRPELAATLGAERFLREIDTAARLNHPHIVPLYDSGDADGLLYFVMPYVEGESLRDLIARQGPLSLGEALHIVREVASALSYAHGKDVIHRDVKPANILLADGHAVVADFGIARAISASGGPSLTQAGIAVGTPEYMSPEQVVGSDAIDGRSDIYSLGCVLYEMLCGAPPFEGQTAQAVIAKRFKEPNPRLGALNNAVSPHIRDALLKAFAPEPADRYASASAFVEALRPPAEPKQTLAQRVGLLGVAGLHLLATLVVLAITRFLVVQLGLPDWVMPGAGVLLLVGLPIMVTTAYVEERIAAGKTPRLYWLTWPRALRGGLLALGGWSVFVVAFMAMRVLGIGPVGTLVAAGVLEEQERIILADFDDRAGDSLLARAVTEAFRVDLAQSPVVTLVDPTYVARVLALMERSPEEPLDLQLAREVAVRDGVKAVVAGEVTSVGGSYVISARLVSAQDGTSLAAYRETAADSSRIIEAIDRLSDRLRERVGESLRTIRGNERLEEVTTASLGALQKYSQAMRVLSEGDVTRATALLEEAVALDTTFAMAYRKLGVVALDRAQQVEALTRAYQYRDRLTDRERYLTEATYYGVVTDEEDLAIAAYRAVLETYPSEYVALNNLATHYLDRRDFARAELLTRRAIEADALATAAHQNTVLAQVAQGKWDEARETLAHWMEMAPEHPVTGLQVAALASARGDYGAAEAALLALREGHGGDALWSTQANGQLATLALLQGRLREAGQYQRAAAASASDLNLPDFQLANEVQLAFVNLWFRGRHAEALRQVEQAVERFPMDAVDPLNRPYTLLAMFYALAHEPDRARAILAEYEREIAPELRRGEEEERHTILGVVALAEGRTDDAVTEFQASDVGPCTICSLPLLGMAYDMGGQTDSALATYERFVEDPWLYRAGVDWWSLPGIYQRLGELYAQRGDAEKAIDYYGRFVELWRDADAELQPRVEAARREISRLAGEPRVGS